jgi:hypothetical protein
MKREFESLSDSQDAGFPDVPIPLRPQLVVDHALTEATPAAISWIAALEPWRIWRGPRRRSAVTYLLSCGRGCKKIASPPEPTVLSEPKTRRGKASRQRPLPGVIEQVSRRRTEYLVQDHGSRAVEPQRGRGGASRRAPVRAVSDG